MAQNKNRTKNIKLAAYILFLALIFLSSGIREAYASFYNITHNCADNVCIVGKTAEWTVTIRNEGSKVIEFVDIELVNTLNDSLFAELKISFLPLSSERGNTIEIMPNHVVKVNISGKIPQANYGKNLVYYACFTNAVTDSYNVAKYDRHEFRHCYKQNFSMPVVECASDKDCIYTEFCSFDSCLKLNCSECQYALDHKCFDYECCNSEQCSFNEVCRNNLCVNLDCRPGEYIENRTCVALNCGFDEYIVNKTCRKLNCSYDEFILNHTCSKLECTENEYIDEHKCKPLNCREDEYAANHTCRMLDCGQNEAAINHRCVALECSFFQEIKDHQCINNKPFIIKSVLELIAIFAIIIFLVMDIIKYEKGKGKMKNKPGIRPENL